MTVDAARYRDFSRLEDAIKVGSCVLHGDALLRPDMILAWNLLAFPVVETAFQSDEIRAVFEGFPASLQPGLLALRELIFDEAQKHSEVGEIQECLKWGQPSYLTAKSKSGSTIRLGLHKQGGMALFVHCQTTLMSDFLALFPDDFRVDGHRAVLFEKKPTKAEQKKLRVLIRSALLYHRLKAGS